MYHSQDMPVILSFMYKADNVLALRGCLIPVFILAKTGTAFLTAPVSRFSSICVQDKSYFDQFSGFIPAARKISDMSGRAELDYSLDAASSQNDSGKTTFWSLPSKVRSTIYAYVFDHPEQSWVPPQHDLGAGSVYSFPSIWTCEP